MDPQNLPRSPLDDKLGIIITVAENVSDATLDSIRQALIAEVTTAALMSENKHLAHPTVIDSTPTSANQEDHVSMAAHGARRLERMNQNLAVILGVEAICAAQGIDFRAPLPTSAPLQAVVARLRQDVATLGDDRYMAPDLAAAARLIATGALTTAAAIPLPFICS